MKNKNLIAAISKAFKIEESVFVSELEKENGTDEIIKDKFSVYTPTELATLIKNSNEAALENADFEITKVPKKLYSKIATAVLESKEKELAKTNGIDKWESLSDLVSKITEKIKSGTAQTTDEKDAQIATLKQTIKGMEETHKTALEAEQQKLQAELTGRDFNQSLSSLGLDYDGEVLTKQQTLFKNAFYAEHKMSNKDGKTIVIGQDGKPIVDKLGEPISPNEVLKSFATNYGFKLKQEDLGGRGSGQFPDKGKPENYKGKTIGEVAKEKGLKPNTPEFDALNKEVAEANKTT